MPGCIAAMTSLQSCHLIRRRTGGDQDRTVLEPLPRPGQRAPRFIPAGDHLIGIEMQHRHHGLGACDLLQRGLRTTAGKAARPAAATGASEPASAPFGLIRLEATSARARPSPRPEAPTETR